jgi:hypothetical protein
MFDITLLEISSVCKHLVLSIYKCAGLRITPSSFERCDNTISMLASFHLLVLVELPAKKLSSSFITKSGRSSGIQ